MTEGMLIVVVLPAISALVTLVLAWLVFSQRQLLQELPRQIGAEQENRHRAMLNDMADGLAKQGERIAASQNDASDRLRQSFATLQLEQSRNLADNRGEIK